MEEEVPGCLGQGTQRSLLNPLFYSFKNVIFDIIPGDEAGKFEVNAKFLGVDMERFQLQYQVRAATRPCLPGHWVASPREK